MPTLYLTVVQPPRTFPPEGAESIELWLDAGKDTRVRADWQPNGDAKFKIPFEVGPDRSGAIVPKGPVIRYHGDKRPFVYLDWTIDHRCFRRIKVFFEKFFDPAREEYHVAIAGTDRRGGPACATATIVSVA